MNIILNKGGWGTNLCIMVTSSVTLSAGGGGGGGEIALIQSWEDNQ